LARTYEPPPDVDEHTRQFLQELQTTVPLDPANCITYKITRQDFQQHWRNAREQTSSSVSGLHYGHYKTVVHSDQLPEASLWPDGNLGYQPVMLEKVVGAIKVNKLHAILLLMEADLDFTTAWLMFAKWMIARAKDNHWIPSKIHGGQKNYEAIEVALNCWLVVDISRQCHVPFAIASVDAQTCYDHLTHSITSIVLQGWDVDPRAIVAMLTTIQGLKFYL
jgi:hypothetical protein